MATLRAVDFTLISATVSPYAQLDLEPKDTYATIRCDKQQRRTKTTHDHGRSPVWNETFVFNLEDQDLPKFVFVQVFAIRSDTDELLGVARIRIHEIGEVEGSLHVMVSPNNGETGLLKAVWRWKSNAQGLTTRDSISSSSVDNVAKDTRDYSHMQYPHSASTYDDVTSAMAKLAVRKGQDKKPYPSLVSDAVSPGTYPPNNTVDERSTFTSVSYPPPADLSQSSYAPLFSEVLPYQPKADAYPPYPDYYKPSSSSEESHSSTGKRGESPSNSTTRGIGDTKDKGHHTHMPYGYAPPAMYGGGYPPPLAYPSPYGFAPGGYPPAPAYPPAPHSVPPAPYGYPPTVNPYQPQAYPYGYPPQAPYPVHSGHGSYAPGMYVGHSSSWKHSKHYKHHKMPKHSMYQYGHPQPHYPVHGHHYKHKKNKIFGKRHKFKKFKGFKKFKF